MQRELVFYRSGDEVPFRKWLDTLPKQARAKCGARLERLRMLGHLLRRPEADYLRDGICELRLAFAGLNLRALYFFHGTEVVVVTTGVVKQAGRVPETEIERARTSMSRYLTDPEAHSFRGPMP